MSLYQNSAQRTYRRAVAVTILLLLAGCATVEPEQKLSLHGPCAPDLVSLGLKF
jgi:hypothetical protein